MKKIIAFAVLFAVAATAFAQTAIPLEQALDNCATYLKNQLPRGARVAVFRIETRSDDLSEQITDSLSAKIVAQNYLTVVERGRTLRMLASEQRYQQLTGNVSDETMAAVGKQLGVEMIITGSITPRGDAYNMNVRVVHVESARIQTQWTANAIYMDSSLAQIAAPTVTATIRFAGTALEINDQDSLIQDIHRALGNYNLSSIEIIPTDEAPANTPYNFLVTLRVNSRTSAQSADLTIALRRGNRILKQSERHTFSELNMEYIIRKGGEIIINDKAFFQSLPGILANQ